MTQDTRLPGGIAEATLERLLEDAVAAHVKGASATAQQLYRQLLAVRPTDLRVLTNFGVLAAQTGQTSLAIELLNRAIAADRTQPMPLNNLGMLLTLLKRYEEALLRLDEAIALAPAYADAHSNRGIALAHLGRDAEALASHEQAQRLQPASAIMHYHYGALLGKLGRSQPALASLDTALQLDSRCVPALIARADVLLGLHRTAEALADYERALVLRPNDVDALVNRAAALIELLRPQEALVSSDLALRVAPRSTLAHVNRGLALCELGRYENALEAFARALELDPHCGRAYHNRAGALMQMQSFEAALTSCDRAIELLPGNPDPILGKALCLLLLGRFPQGWPLYEARLNGALCPMRLLDAPVPRWRGECLQGKTLFVRWEQGLGDTLQFCRYTELITRMGARVVLEVQPALGRLLTRLRGEVRVVTDTAEIGAADFFCPLLSLPGALETAPESIPAHVPYLTAEPERIERWRRHIGDEGYRIGVCWQGLPQANVDRGRSFPLRLLLQYLADLPGVRLISLQKHDGLEQLKDLPPGSVLETLGEDFDSGPDAFLDSAAVLMQLDLLVTSDTAIAHLAGALGREAWVALRQVPDWRWMLGREDSPWYPTHRLFRQSTQGDWHGVFACMREALILRLGGVRR
jgi:tetratricopeptide (TPR) repeat protein